MANFKRNNFRREKSEFDSRTLDIARVTRVVAGGRRFRFRVLVVAGDRKGRVGLGIGKGMDLAASIEKATNSARRNLVQVPLNSDSTIPFPIRVKFGTVVIFMRPGVKGRGLIAGGVVRPICELAGVRDINAKIISRSANKINNARAVLKAFEIIKSSPKYKHANTSDKKSEEK